MKSVRIIPRIDIKGPNLVKGIHLEGLRVLGKPSDFAKFYFENGADELIFMDVVASLYERNNLHQIISETSKNVFIPITVGGGLRNINDIRSILRVGADKVSLNTAVIKNKNLINEAAKIFGSSTIVVAIETIKDSNGKYLAYTDNGREFTGLDVIEWSKIAEDLGAGEIVLTSVDKEGTGEGPDYELIEKINSLISIPLIVHGGFGKKEHVYDIFKNQIIDSVCIASMFHYDFINNYKMNFNNQEGNIEFLNNKRSFHTFEPLSISDLKKYLIENKINCRIIK